MVSAAPQGPDAADPTPEYAASKIAVLRAVE
jgi:hypothetical protein